MTRELSQSSRRRFIRIGTAALVSAPFAGTLLSGNAGAAEALSESDPTAVALGYKTDAAKAPNRKDKTSVCGNCSLFTGKAGASDGPCNIFGGKIVNAKGWCSAWAKKA